MKEFCPTFSFKQFAIDDRRCGMKVGTDGVLLGAWAGLDSEPSTILDVGAGSGLIALMLAQRFAEAEISAVEIDAEAFADLSDNCEQSPWGSRISRYNCDFREIKGSYDLMVCNPPFFTNGDIAPEASRALARHSGQLSPTSFLRFCSTALTDKGICALVAPIELSDEIELEAALCRLYPRRKALVATSPRRGVTRGLWEFSHVRCPMEAEAEKIVVNSDEYAALTRDFYLHY